MYAVIKTGGKQYKVQTNDIIEVEKLDKEAGSTVKFEEVLLIDDGKEVKVGNPNIAGAAVVAEIITQKKDDKILVFKKKRRHNYRRTKGHRQPLSLVRITDLGFGGKAKAAPKKEEAKTEKKAAPKTEAKSEAKAEKKPAAKKQNSK
jgi:large subunit ribosomal protein L21